MGRELAGSPTTYLSLQWKVNSSTINAVKRRTPGPREDLSTSPGNVADIRLTTPFSDYYQKNGGRST